MANLPYWSYVDNSHGKVLPRSFSIPLVLISSQLSDPAHKLPDIEPQSSGLLNTQHQLTSHPFISSFHPATPILDLGFRENQPAHVRWTSESNLGNSATDRIRDTPRDLSALQLDQICHFNFDSWVSVCACCYGYVFIFACERKYGSDRV